MILRILFLATFFLMVSCKPDSGKKSADAEKKAAPSIQAPPFNEDSAYLFVKRQIDFGPRIPNTKAHQKTGDYLINKFEEYGAEIYIQKFEQTSYDGERLQLKNIVASFFPEKQKRLLLASHWDTRPFADKDIKNPNAAFDGANDGASGVGVLLEVARVLSFADQSPEVGIDIILFDGEDWGEKENESTPPLPPGLDSWWCLGSQHWSRNKHVPNYAAYYGILLDMVGAKDAQFHREEGSLMYAPKIVDKVWNSAERLGYGHVFVKKTQGGITDDHIFVNKYAKIPMVDIVHYDLTEGYFGANHHTQQDNMEGISRETLDAVGKTVLDVIYNEKGNIN